MKCLFKPSLDVKPFILTWLEKKEDDEFFPILIGSWNGGEND
jgi:hypothetical protein